MITLERQRPFQRVAGRLRHLVIADTFNSAGGLIIADTNDHRIREVSG